MAPQSTNPYLNGNFGPVAEETTAFDLPVVGSIPEGLDGRFLRNGPNPLVAADPATYHWFSGDGMVHGVRLRDGKAAWYRNRWVRSGSTAAGGLGGAPTPGPIHGGMDFGPNTNVIGFAGRTWALVEAGANPVELTYELDTIGPNDFDGTLVPGGYTAHPKLDPFTGELHAVNYHWGWGNVVKYVVVGPDAAVRSIVDVELGGGSMVHDMGLSASSALVFDLPCLFDLDVAMTGARLPYRWKPDYQARVGVVRRDTPSEPPVWCEVSSCYVFHPLNTFDAPDGTIVMDVVRHPRMFDTVVLGPDDGTPTLWRWTIDPATRTVREEQLDDRGVEFPRHDERLVGRPHRFGLAAHVGPHIEHGGIVRYDLERSTSVARGFGPGRRAGEPVFVPRSDDAPEGDGWILAFVYDQSTDTSDVVILDSEAFDGEPVATIKLPVRVPYGFHGNWSPG